MNLTAQKLEDILDEERFLLLGGKFIELEKVRLSKLRLLEIINQNPSTVSEDQVRRLSQKSKINEDLLVSVQRGLRAAMACLKDAQDANFQSYSKEGCKVQHTKPAKFGKYS